MKVYMFFADGFEEIEALTSIDLLRRAGVDAVMVSVKGELMVVGSHDIKVTVDELFKDDIEEYSDGDMLILPGGPGHAKLMGHEGIRELLFEYRNKNKKIAAICAAPSILGMNGLLKGKKATCFPGYEDKLLGATVTNDKVVVDGNIITSRGMGTSMEFALAIVEELLDKAQADDLAKKVQYL